MPPFGYWEKPRKAGASRRTAPTPACSCRPRSSASRARDLHQGRGRPLHRRSEEEPVGDAHPADHARASSSKRDLPDLIVERVVIEYLPRARFCKELQIVNGLKPGQVLARARGRGCRDDHLRVASAWLLAALAACESTPKQPEADPAHVKALATKMAQNTPAPQAARACQPNRPTSACPTLTDRTLLQLADLPIKADPEHADWIEPAAALESPTVHELTGTDSARPPRRRHRCWACRPGSSTRSTWSNAPMALGIKELKIGTIGGARDPVPAG